MPEGHTVRAIANDWLDLVGDKVSVSSPQGRFAEGALLIDGRTITAVRPHGKHLFVGFDNDLWLHVHLGRFGSFFWRESDPVDPPAGNTVRMRLIYSEGHVDLRGAMVVEVIDDARKSEIHSSLGPDPLNQDDDIEAVMNWVRRYKTPIGAILMHQSVIAGIGNIYRAEILWRLKIDPWTPTSDVTDAQFRAIWADAVLLLEDGVLQHGYATSTAHIPLPDGTLPNVSGYGNKYNKTNVYDREGLPCPRCGDPIVSELVEGRKMYSCKNCQK